LGGKGGSIPKDEVQKAVDSPRRIFRLSDASGPLKFEEIKTGKITKSLFNTNDVFIFDAGHEIFAWVGLKASQQEKRMALQYAQKYLHDYKRPPYLSISRVLEGGENEIFFESLDDASQFGYTFKKTDARGERIAV
jgi:gelsolin